jgi:uncharacterized membrane protein YkvA (DUF1232 family)
VKGKAELEARLRETAGRVTDADVARAATDGRRKLAHLAGAVPDALRAVWDDLGTLIAMLGDYVSGRYRAVPLGSIAAVAAAVLYFLSPIDLIPDLIPVVGYADDATVVLICLKWVHDDLERYRKWRSAGPVAEK